MTSMKTKRTKTSPTSRPSSANPTKTSSLLKKVFEVSLWATLIQDPSARRTKDSQPSGFGFEYCASHVRFRVFQQTARTVSHSTFPLGARHEHSEARLQSTLQRHAREPLGAHREGPGGEPKLLRGSPRLHRQR